MKSVNREAYVLWSTVPTLSSSGCIVSRYTIINQQRIEKDVRGAMPQYWPEECEKIHGHIHLGLLLSRPRFKLESASNGQQRSYPVDSDLWCLSRDMSCIGVKKLAV